MPKQAPHQHWHCNICFPATRCPVQNAQYRAMHTWLELPNHAAYSRTRHAADSSSHGWLPSGPRPSSGLSDGHNLRNSVSRNVPQYRTSSAAFADAGRALASRRVLTKVETHLDEDVGKHGNWLWMYVMYVHKHDIAICWLYTAGLMRLNKLINNYPP